jgi:hypothetical protein
VVGHTYTLSAVQDNAQYVLLHRLIIDSTHTPVPRSPTATALEDLVSYTYAEHSKVPEDGASSSIVGSQCSVAERSPELILLTAGQPILGSHEVTLICNDTRAEAANIVPGLCGGLWDNLKQFPGCIGVSQLYCEAKDGGLSWGFAVGQSCDNGMLEATWFDATENVYGSISRVDVGET